MTSSLVLHSARAIHDSLAIYDTVRLCIALAGETGILSLRMDIIARRGARRRENEVTWTCSSSYQRSSIIPIEPGRAAWISIRVVRPMSKMAELIRENPAAIRNQSKSLHRAARARAIQSLQFGWRNGHNDQSADIVNSKNNCCHVFANRSRGFNRDAIKNLLANIVWCHIEISAEEYLVRSSRFCPNKSDKCKWTFPFFSFFIHICSDSFNTDLTADIQLSKYWLPVVLSDATSASLSALPNRSGAERARVRVKEM